MSRVYRILRKAYAKKPFDGEGAYRFGGRCSSVGTRLAYTAEHLSLATIEYFIHIDPDDPPKDLLAVRADVPDSISRTLINPKQLPANWRQSPLPTELVAEPVLRELSTDHHEVPEPNSKTKTDTRNWHEKVGMTRSGTPQRQGQIDSKRSPAIE